MSKNTFCKNFTKLYTFLINNVNIPYKSLEHNLILEMIAGLIDVENRATSMHDRKVLLDSLEKCIKRDFYADEDDATDYYRKQLQRKKDMGGKYNEKFFVNIKEEGGEFEDVSEGTE